MQNWGERNGKSMGFNPFQSPEVGLEVLYPLVPETFTLKCWSVYFSMFFCKGYYQPKTLMERGSACVRGQLDVVNGAVSGCGLRELVRQQPF